MGQGPAFKKQAAGVYFAADDHFAYRLTSEDGGRYWELQVRELTETAGVRHSLGQPVIDQTTADRKADLAAVAAHYSGFGARDAYRGSEHGHMSRMTAAVHDAYDEMD